MPNPVWMILSEESSIRLDHIDGMRIMEDKDGDCALIILLDGDGIAIMRSSNEIDCKVVMNGLIKLIGGRTVRMRKFLEEQAVSREVEIGD